MFTLKDAQGKFIVDSDNGKEVDYPDLGSAIAGLKKHRAAAVVEFGRYTHIRMSPELAAQRYAAECGKQPFEMPAYSFVGENDGEEVRFRHLGVGDMFSLPGSPGVFIKRTHNLALRLSPMGQAVGLTTMPEHFVVKPSASVAERISSTLDLQLR